MPAPSSFIIHFTLPFHTHSSVPIFSPSSAFCDVVFPLFFFFSTAFIWLNIEHKWHVTNASDIYGDYYFTVAVKGGGDDDDGRRCAVRSRYYFTFWWPLVYYRWSYIFLYFNFFFFGWTSCARRVCVSRREIQKDFVFYYVPFDVLLLRSVVRVDHFCSVHFILFCTPVIKTSHRWLTLAHTGSVFMPAVSAFWIYHTFTRSCSRRPDSRNLYHQLWPLYISAFICLYQRHYQFFNFMCDEHAIDANEKLLSRVCESDPLQTACRNWPTRQDRHS